jgi:NAD(P)-dependent dehydrogenase (short-subunit alcohol dehydrogenase family)
MGVRSLEKGNAAIAEIKKEHPSVQIDLLQMDLMNLTSVVEAAKHFLTLETALHGLVNNAGIMATPFEMTKDNHEAQWQTNYLSHWVLTEHLLPLMQQTAKTLPAGSVRIVNLTSSGHMSAPKTGINFDDLALKDQSVWERYGQSKLANILHSNTLNEKYGPGSENKDGEIWITSVHPGLVETNLTTTVDSGEKGMLNLISALRCLRLLWSADKGSWNSLFCAAGQEMKAEQSGKYIELYHRFGEPWWQSGPSKDGELAKKLDEWTRENMIKEGWIQ